MRTKRHGGRLRYPRCVARVFAGLWGCMYVSMCVCVLGYSQALCRGHEDTVSDEAIAMPRVCWRREIPCRDHGREACVSQALVVSFNMSLYVVECQ